MYEGNNQRSSGGATRRAVSLGGAIRGAGRYEPPRRRSGGTGGGFGGASRGRSAGTGAFSGGRSRNQGGRGRGGESIDVSRFVNKSVVIEEVKTYIPTHQFADFAIEDSLKKNIENKGYKIPTAIQDRAIPDVLAGPRCDRYRQYRRREDRSIPYSR